MPLDSLVGPLAAFLAPPAPAPATQFHGAGEVHTSIYAGLRLLSDEFEPAEEPLLLGIAFDVHEPGDRASFEAGYFLSLGDGDARIGATNVEVESRIHEIWMGGRWNFDPWEGPLRPYVGVGFSALNAKYETKALGQTSSNDGWAFGAYAHGGIEWRLGGGWAVGLDMRGLVSTPATLQEEVPLDYWQGALTFGWTW
jgi:hypothetical protein